MVVNGDDGEVRMVGAWHVLVFGPCLVCAFVVFGKRFIGCTDGCSEIGQTFGDQTDVRRSDRRSRGRTAGEDQHTLAINVEERMMMR